MTSTLSSGLRHLRRQRGRHTLLVRMGQDDVLRPQDPAAARADAGSPTGHDRSPDRSDRTGPRRHLPLPSRRRQRLRDLAGGRRDLHDLPATVDLGLLELGHHRDLGRHQRQDQPERLRNRIRSRIRTDGGLREYARRSRAASLPAGNAAEPVAIHLSDLEGIVYHFRVVAHNTWGTTATSDRTFTFFPPSCPNWRASTEDRAAATCRTAARTSWSHRPLPGTSS